MLLYPPIQTNTFQCAIATNGEVTTVLLLYPEDLIEWTTGDSDGGVGGLGGDPADVGLIAPDAISNNSFLLPFSNTSFVREIESTGNVFSEGLWMFRADSETVIFPGEKLVVCLVVCLFVVVLAIVDVHAFIMVVLFSGIAELVEVGSGSAFASASGSGDGGKTALTSVLISDSASGSDS